METPVAGLSGGNQQKVALAKWLGRNAKLLIIDEPTRGVDVGAKAAIHGLIDELAGQGIGIMLISSELPELLNLSSRVLVMRQGGLVGELKRDEVTQERVLRLMAGVERARTWRRERSLFSRFFPDRECRSAATPNATRVFFRGPFGADDPAVQDHRQIQQQTHHAKSGP